jgi:hypothetical protein
LNYLTCPSLLLRPSLLLPRILQVKGTVPEFESCSQELINDERIISKKEREILSLRFGLDNQPELTLSAAAARTLAVWRPCRRLIGGVFLTLEERCLGLLEDPLKAYYKDVLIFGYQPWNVTFRQFTPQ